MITIVQGVVGGGKTIFAVEETIRRISEGGHVYTNVDMDEAQCRGYVMRKHKRYLKRGLIRKLPETENIRTWVDFIDFGSVEDPILVVLDEAQMFWNSRDWAKTAKAEGENPMLSFLTQSRKAGVDVMVISQDAGNIDKQFRVLAQSVVTARNMAHMKLPIFGISLKGFILYTWMETATRSIFKSRWWRIDKGLFKCYKTEAFLDSIMQEMAETKGRLERVQLRSVDWVRSMVYNLEQGDLLEKWIGKLLRPWAACRLKRQRRGS